MSGGFLIIVPLNAFVGSSYCSKNVLCSGLCLSVGISFRCVCGTRGGLVLASDLISCVGTYLP